MRFLNIKTNKTQHDIDIIILNMSNSDFDYLDYIYSLFDYVEYTDDNDMECMFCVVNDFELSKITECFLRFEIDFKFEDLSKDIFYDNKFKINFKNHSGLYVKHLIKKLIEDFKNNNITIDIILDKILERGINSLSSFDYTTLKNFRN